MFTAGTRAAKQFSRQVWAPPSQRSGMRLNTLLLMTAVPVRRSTNSQRGTAGIRLGRGDSGMPWVPGPAPAGRQEGLVWRQGQRRGVPGRAGRGCAHGLLPAGPGQNFWGPWSGFLRALQSSSQCSCPAAFLHPRLRPRGTSECCFGNALLLLLLLLAHCLRCSSTASAPRFFCATVVHHAQAWSASAATAQRRSCLRTWWAGQNMRQADAVQC